MGNEYPASIADCLKQGAVHFATDRFSHQSLPCVQVTQALALKRCGFSIGHTTISWISRFAWSCPAMSSHWMLELSSRISLHTISMMFGSCFCSASGNSPSWPTIHWAAFAMMCIITTCTDSVSRVHQGSNGGDLKAKHCSSFACIVVMLQKECACTAPKSSCLVRSEKGPSAS